MSLTLGLSLGPRAGQASFQRASLREPLVFVSLGPVTQPGVCPDGLLLVILKVPIFTAAVAFVLLWF